MIHNPNRDRILVAEDDDDDRLLLRDAFAQVGLDCELTFVADGRQLIEHLRECGTKGAQFPPPKLILLDLNMPRQDGREVLAVLKGDEDLKHIPVIVLTTSRADPDISLTYELGANSFISKPNDFNELVRMVRVIGEFWLRLVALPPRSEHG